MNKEALELVITEALGLIDKGYVKEAKELLEKTNDRINEHYEFKYGRYVYKG